jgi:carbamoyl-phosphate synthase small subunit
MTQTENNAAWPDHKPTALLVLADGTVLEGFGLGAEGQAVGEVCFNTAMTGYEEILTDPSYAGQLITFTFPHIGNVGTNDEDIETVNMAATPGARGVRRTTAPRATSTSGCAPAASSASPASIPARSPR